MNERKDEGCAEMPAAKKNVETLRREFAQLMAGYNLLSADAQLHALHPLYDKVAEVAEAARAEGLAAPRIDSTAAERFLGVSPECVGGEPRVTLKVGAASAEYTGEAAMAYVNQGGEAKDAPPPKEPGAVTFQDAWRDSALVSDVRTAFKLGWYKSAEAILRGTWRDGDGDGDGKTVFESDPEFGAWQDDRRQLVSLWAYDRRGDALREARDAKREWMLRASELESDQAEKAKIIDQLGVELEFVRRVADRLGADLREARRLLGATRYCATSTASVESDVRKFLERTAK